MTPAHLPAAELTSGIVAEIGQFADLAEGLNEADRRRRTRFWGLPAGDVVAHVAGVLSDVTSGRVTNLVTPAAAARQVIERVSSPPDRVAAELRDSQHNAALTLETFTPETWASPARPGFEGTIAEAVQAIWEDIWLHGGDIRDALGIKADRGSGPRAAVHHLLGRLERRGWNGRVELEGHEPFQIGDATTVVACDPHVFVLIGTSRAERQSNGVDPSVVVET